MSSADCRACRSRRRDSSGTPIRFRGNGGSCWPLVWLDGAPLPTAEFDLDFLSPSSIEGIEVYSGISQMPPQFMGSRGLGSCGVIVVWSREGERREKKRKKPVTATELAEMVASLKVYTPEQVDVPARSDSLSRPQPLYPGGAAVHRRAGPGARRVRRGHAGSRGARHVRRDLVDEPEVHAGGSARAARVGVRAGNAERQARAAARAAAVQLRRRLRRTCDARTGSSSR